MSKNTPISSIITLEILAGDPKVVDGSGPGLYVWASADSGNATFTAMWVGTDSSSGYDYDLEVDTISSANMLRFANINLPRANLNSSLEINGDQSTTPQTSKLQYKGWVGPHMDGLVFDYPQVGDTLTFNASANDGFPKGFSPANVFLGGDKASLSSLGYTDTKFSIILSAG